MSDLSDLEIGVPGPFLPPWENVMKNAQVIDSLGYDSMAFPDHFAGFIPESLWTTDITPLALLQSSPHTYYELSSIMAACAVLTKNVKIISAVTEPLRRHPVLLAQTFLTLDHISQGRAIMGIGAGEAVNVTPYGIDYSAQVGKLREALEIIQLLWSTDTPLDYNGRFWHLKDAVLSLRPLVPNQPPPIWIAAHGPKMLEIAAQFGDGWIPTLLRPTDYRQRLATIESHRKRLGRENPFTPALWNWFVLDNDSAELERLIHTPLARAMALLYPASEWRRLGHAHPFGEDFYSLRDYIPMGMSRETALAAIDEVPDDVLHEFYYVGDAESIIQQLEDFVHVGLRHIIIWNVTGMFDLNKARSSNKILKEVLRYVKG
ncbi:MAG: LLM class flavin-dependent oxidoreductase [Candidatus Thorarchaeota archaeon]|nr:LLM class flavin-dependent oxidoreductase [Candidatus Thorarchaeota archaeon]